MQLPDSLDGLDCQIRWLISSRNLLRVSKVVCWKLNIHSSHWLTRCHRLADLLLSPVAPPGHLTFLHNVSTSLSFRKQISSKVSKPWSSTISWQFMPAPNALKDCSHGCLHRFFTFLCLGFLPAIGRIYDPVAQETLVPFGVPTSLHILISKIWFKEVYENLILSEILAKLWGGTFGIWVILLESAQISPHTSPILHVGLLNPDYWKIHVEIPGNLSNFLVWCSPFS